MIDAEGIGRSFGNMEIHWRICRPQGFTRIAEALFTKEDVKSDHGVRAAVESLPTYHVWLMNLMMMEGEEVVKASKDSF